MTPDITVNKTYYKEPHNQLDSVRTYKNKEIYDDYKTKYGYQKVT